MNYKVYVEFWYTNNVGTSPDFKHTYSVNCKSYSQCKSITAKNINDIVKSFKSEGIKVKAKIKIIKG